MSEKSFDLSKQPRSIFLRLQCFVECARDTRSRTDQTKSCAREACINVVVSRWFLLVSL